MRPVNRRETKPRRSTAVSSKDSDNGLGRIVSGFLWAVSTARSDRKRSLSVVETRLFSGRRKRQDLQHTFDHRRTRLDRRSIRQDSFVRRRIRFDAIQRIGFRRFRTTDLFSCFHSCWTRWTFNRSFVDRHKNTDETVLFGMFQCYDVRFPEQSRLLTFAHELGAQILTYPSAFTKQTGEDHWHVSFCCSTRETFDQICSLKVLLRARAIENQCFVVAAAQVGVHGSSKRQSYGHSMVGCLSVDRALNCVSSLSSLR